jgi:hypothetical protein
LWELLIIGPEGSLISLKKVLASGMKSVVDSYEHRTGGTGLFLKKL